MTDNAEYFLLASYSCLPSVVTRLEQLRQRGDTAVLFCFTEPLYRFLRPLAAQFAWITVHFVSEQPAWRIRRPHTLLQARGQTKRLYHQQFANIPAGSTVHFYNRHAALLLFYVVWRLHPTCQIHYTESDMVAMYEPDWSFKSRVQIFIFSLIYPVPMEMIRPKNRQSSIRLPAVSAKTVEQITTQTHKRKPVVDKSQNNLVYQTLRWRSKAKLLWIMGLVLDMDEVNPAAYETLLTRCSAFFAANEQIVKFHPRATRFERFGKEIPAVPTYVPAEFLELEGVTTVITISSTSNAAWGLAPDVKIISLVALIPFVNEAIRERHRQAMQQTGVPFYAPATAAELTQILRGNHVKT